MKTTFFHRRAGVQEKFSSRTSLLISCPPVLNSVLTIGSVLIFPAEINALASLVRSFDKTIKPAGAGGKR
jgi:hypothetical protein